jgi:hypothetical protein
MAWARRLRSELGATVVAGETLPEFRYLLMYVGSAEAGARVELIEPAADGFVTHFLDRRGEGPHHITFTVPDLRDSVSRVRKLGLRVAGENYSHAPWQEAFIAPDGVHGVVLQVAQSDAQYPSPAELLATTSRDVENFPSSEGALDRTWWTPVWDTDPGPTAIAGATHLVSTDPAVSQRLFGDVLGAETLAVDEALEFRWPSGAVRVTEGSTPGVTSIDLSPRGPGAPRPGSFPGNR